MCIAKCTAYMLCAQRQALTRLPASLVLAVTIVLEVTATVCMKKVRSHGTLRIPSHPLHPLHPLARGEGRGQIALRVECGVWVRGRGRTLAPMSTEQSAESSWRMMSEMSTMPATHVGPRGRGGGGGSGRGRGGVWVGLSPLSSKSMPLMAESALAPGATEACAMADDRAHVRHSG